MDPDRFTTMRPGELVKISTPEGPEWAFVPKPLPMGFRIADRHRDLLGDAREQLGTLNGIGQSLPDPRLLIRPLQHSEALRSSSLEGTDVIAEQMLLYALAPKEPAAETNEENAWREVFNHDRALLRGYEGLKTIPLCTRLINDMHRALLTGVRDARGLDKRPGELRDRQVFIGSDHRFVPPPPARLQPLLDDLERYLNAADAGVNPLIRAYMAHYQFETIHPYLDGNGRIGRVLLSLCTYKWHGHLMPWLYMSAFFDRYKDEYVDHLFRVSTHGDWDSWLEFCLRGTISQCKDASLRCTRLNLLRRHFHKQAQSLSSRAHVLVDKLFEHPVFRVRDAMAWCRTTRPTAQKDAEALVEAGIVKHLAGRAPRTYFAPEIMSIAYSELVERLAAEQASKTSGADPVQPQPRPQTPPATA